MSFVLSSFVNDKQKGYEKESRIADAISYNMTTDSA